MHMLTPFELVAWSRKRVEEISSVISFFILIHSRDLTRYNKNAYVLSSDCQLPFAFVSLFHLPYKWVVRISEEANKISSHSFHLFISCSKSQCGLRFKDRVYVYRKIFCNINHGNWNSLAAFSLFQ